jgi:beta-fructofuranosidase
MIGWIPEGRTVAQDREASWSGVQSLPRVLTLRPDGCLGITPVEEVQSLRRQHTRLENVELPANSRLKSGVHGSQLELLVRWHPDAAGQLDVTLAQFPDGEEQTSVVYDPASSELFIDRRHSNTRGNVDLDTQYARLELEKGEALELRIFFDHSVIEVFANQRACLTTRIYPTLNGDLEPSFRSRHNPSNLQSVDIWQLDSIW